MVLLVYHPKYEVQNKTAFEFQEITKKNFLLDTDKENEDTFINFYLIISYEPIKTFENWVCLCSLYHILCIMSGICYSVVSHTTWFYIARVVVNPATMRLRQRRPFR